MMLREFTDVRISSYLKSGAPGVTKARQKAVTLVGQMMPRPLTFTATQDTYFVETDTVGKRHTCVLGWDHAILLKKTVAGYVPEMLVCYGDNTGKGAYGVAPGFEPLTRLDAVDIGGKRWTRRTPPPNLKLERLVTYGVSSCSFAVMFTKDLSYIAVSHMSGGPPIPVREVLKFAVGETKKYLLASVFPQEDELQKFTQAPSLTQGDIEESVLFLRGMEPEQGSGDLIYPQLPHAELGLVFTQASPVLDGILGLEKDFDYSRLLTTGQLNRLRASASEDGRRRDLLFTTGSQPLNALLLRQIFRDRGFALSGGAQLSVVRDQEPREWKLTDAMRTYRIETKVTNAGSETSVEYRYTERTGSHAGRSGRILDPRDTLWRKLDSKDAGVLRGYEMELNVPLGQNATVTVLAPGSRWRIANGDATIEVVKGGSVTVRKQNSTLEYFCANEAQHLVRDIVEPLLKGAWGFPSLHQAIYDGFLKKMRGVGTQGFTWFGLSRDDFRDFECEVAEKVNWAHPIEAGTAFARMLGHFLNRENPNHPYAGIIAEVVQANRFELAFPLTDFV
ncbi:hypothetical protein KYC5002_32935 [Archangium violaceum]|uniref:hypothetical protein n=1 Tax=Archangium violaceum TaxID=83451 RepID=UPI002B2CDB2B|nr:hypothetical protein KYC5002_32935 [Archangium gephyra]